MIRTAPHPAPDGIAGPVVRVLHVGHERQPVVVIDGATGFAPALIDHAARSRFSPAASIGSHYPGLLGPAPTAYVDAMVQATLPLIARHFGTGPVMPARARGNFSLVTTLPDALSPDQRVPHVDTVDALQFAAVHYLCDRRMGGTGFFRHRATGFETIDAARLPAYHRARDAETARSSPPSRYIDATGDTLFEAIAAIDAAPDRLILYRAGLLHSGLIPALPDHADDPRRGRLTGNLFLQCRTSTP